MIDEYTNKNSFKSIGVTSLGQLNYLSSLQYIDFIIGNSSSGIIESASFGKPVVNIGNRQSGRLKGVNIIDTDVKELSESIKMAISLSFINKEEFSESAYKKAHNEFDLSSWANKTICVYYNLS